MRMNATRYARRHKRAVVESQPAAEAAVSGDSHEEEFDFGHPDGTTMQQLPQLVRVHVEGSC
jgi:hypothetical protein